MADYKIVDAEKLEGDLTVLADAIRQRSGTAEKLAFPQGMAETVKNIPAEGTVLPELSNPASAADITAGKTLYDDDGNPVTGTLAEIASGAAISASNNATVAGSVSTGIRIKARRNDGTDYILRDGAYLMVAAPADQFGDAAAADVAKGKTFTSAAGLLMEGTHECGEGVTLPTLTNPAAASDLALDKQLLDGYGNVVTGTLAESAVGTKIWAVHDIALYEGNIGSTQFHMGGVYGKNYIGSDTANGFICRPGSEFWLRNVPSSLFGNAAVSDVAKGKTFTSAAGLLVEGTLEPGSGDNTALIQLLERSAGELTVPEGCTRIGDYAFYYNAAVTAVSLPDTVTNIGYRSFYQCTGLSELRLPAGLDSIDTQAFYNCKGLTSLTFRSTPSSIASNAFGACSGLTTIHVPWASGAVADAPWGATNAVIHYNDSGEGA